MRTKKVQKSRQTFRSVGNAVGDGADGPVSDMRADNVVGDAVGIGVGKAVGNPSVNVAKSRNFFQLSVKYRRVIYRRYIRR